MKVSGIAICSVAFLYLSSMVAEAQTYMCDVKAATGFDRDRGYRALNFNAVRSYRISLDVNKEDLTLEYERQNDVFEWANENYRPASIQRLDGQIVELCFFRKGIRQYSDTNSCDTVFNGDFSFDLGTGQFSVLYDGFERLTAGQTVAEVGECRRIN